MKNKILVVPFEVMLVEGSMTYCSKCLQSMFNPRIVFLDNTRHLRLHEDCYDMIKNSPFSLIMLVDVTTKRKIDGWEKK